MISHDLRCIFCHIPKTGGSSIEVALTGYDWITQSPGDWEIYQREVQRYSPTWGGTLIEKDVEYFAKTMSVKHAQQWVQRELYQEHWNAYLRFTFVRNPWARVYSLYRMGRRDRPERMPDNLSAWVCAQDSRDHMGDPAFRRFADNFAEFDFVGRFESLEADFARLCERLGIPGRPLPQVLHGGSTHSLAYREVYDARARDVVAERFANVVERFRYEF